mmetsp:Transcript_26698/g.30567  ORF Transcript_26698/g.30567 Transcript_26698/m.30567 type:complete len:388 (+) Transcript_26698:124-1287(+)
MVLSPATGMLCFALLILPSYYFSYVQSFFLQHHHNLNKNNNIISQRLNIHRQFDHCHRSQAYNNIDYKIKVGSRFMCQNDDDDKDDGVKNTKTATTNSSSTNTISQTSEHIAFPNLTILGICGSIGSGKSYASSLLVSQLNNLTRNTNITSSKTDEQKQDESVAYHIDTDSLAHGVYVPRSQALKEIEEEFGKNVIAEDGNVDRKALGAIVFGDDMQMAKLEQIVWPHVKNLLVERLEQIEKASKLSPSNSSIKNIVVVEAAVLLDANWDSNQLFDGIWVIRSSTKTRTERLVSKRNMNEKDALQRIKAQYKRRGIGNSEEEIENGTVTAVIENDGGVIDINSTSDDTVNNNQNGNELWDDLCKCLIDPQCWKDDRCPYALEQLLFQ